MGIVFKQGSVLYIATETRKYQLLVGDVSASQTFIGNTQKVKTIQNKQLIDRTFVTEKGKASLNFTAFVGRSSPDTAIAEWFDLEKNFHRNYELTSNTEIPSTRDIYIQQGTTVYKLPKMCGATLSFTISHSEVMAVSISAIGPDLVDISSDAGAMSTFNALTEEVQDVSEFHVESVRVTDYDNILGVTAEITREISWLNQKSLFDLGTIYKVTNPVITSMSISGSITQTKLNNNNNTYTPSSVVEIKYGNNFKIKMNGCSLTERFDLGDFHRVVTDYALLPNTTNSLIQF